ncbi:MAG: zinc ribbon domain-containing protein [Ferrimicrobium sp.]
MLKLGKKREPRTHYDTCLHRRFRRQNAQRGLHTSQTCPNPTCGYVSRDNRHGDMFHCRNPYWECNWQGDVDHVAAMNIQIKDRRSPDQPVHPL